MNIETQCRLCKKPLTVVMDDSTDPLLVTSLIALAACSSCANRHKPKPKTKPQPEPVEHKLPYKD
jgi:hypothetical protein